jgi:hypothetical protein
MSEATYDICAEFDQIALEAARAFVAAGRAEDPLQRSRHRIEALRLSNRLLDLSGSSGRGSGAAALPLFRRGAAPNEP